MTEQPIPDALLIRAHEILFPGVKSTSQERLDSARRTGTCVNLARYLMTAEEEPVDPLLEIAREACAEWYDRFRCRGIAEDYRNGKFDEGEDRSITIAINAARKAYELGKGEA